MTAETYLVVLVALVTFFVKRTKGDDQVQRKQKDTSQNLIE